MEIMKHLKFFLMTAVMFTALLTFSGCAPQSQKIGTQDWSITNTATYTWDEAQKACPAGFHLPRIVEMEAMENARRTEGKMRPTWCFGERGDIFEANLCYTSALSVFWTSEEADKNSAYAWDVELDYTYFKPQAYDKNEHLSIICTKD